MKTAGSVLQLVVDSKPRGKHRERNDQLVDIGPRSVPWSAVNAFSKRLRIEPAAIERRRS